MSRIVLIRHGDDPDDDRVVTYFRSKGLEPEIRKPFKGGDAGRGRHDPQQHRWFMGFQERFFGPALRALAVRG